MFLLKIYDRDCVELKLGDIVEVSDGKKIKFYCRVTFLESVQKLAPFHTFSFHSVRKVEAPHVNATRCTEDRYECWYLAGDDQIDDMNAATHEKYLADWQACERLLEKSAFSVIPVQMFGQDMPEWIFSDGDILQKV